ncbi:MAG TPA: cell division protein ZipA C-terminal FtsZ-binding domain-containing protein, partial [Puia sp.]
RLTFPPPATHDDEYKGDPELEWLIEIFPPANGTFDKDRLWKIFDADWRRSHPGFKLYGHSTEDHRWHYVIAGNTPGSYHRLQAGWPLVERYIPEDGQEIMSVKTLTKFREDLVKKLNRNFSGITLQEPEDIPAAINKAEKLAVIQKRFGRDAILVLKSDSLYPGRLAWDALISVGLRWGDGDLFHWEADAKHNYDQLFSVWTMTPPGYFFPENILAGTFNPTELIFGFPIPRCFNPLQVFDAMADAAEYCRKRLGGSIVNPQGQSFDRQAERDSLTRLVQEMKDSDLEPGSPLALRIF